MMPDGEKEALKARAVAEGNVDVVNHKSRKVPIGPTEEQRRKHNETHLPYRSWCAICVAAKATEEGHMRKKEPETAVPVVQADYAEVKRQDDPDKVKILTCRDKKSGEFLTVYARQKGSQDGYQVAATK